MQHIAGLTSLRALHVVRLHTDDTCMWVMRETTQFLVDNISHYPELDRLEWLAVEDCDRVDRLVRVKDWEGRYGSQKSSSSGSVAGGAAGGSREKGKGKEVVVVNGNGDEKAKGKLGGTTTTGASSSSTSGLAGVESVDDVDVSALISAELGEDSDETASVGSESDDGDGDTDSEDEGAGFYGQKIEVVEGMSFCEVEGVRIFKKEVVAGRL